MSKNVVILQCDKPSCTNLRNKIEYISELIQELNMLFEQQYL